MNDTDHPQGFVGDEDPTSRAWAKTPPADPFALLAGWLALAERTEPHNHNAMTLATADGLGHPSARIVLLKGIDSVGASPRGLVFYTNYHSRKGQAMAENPRGGLTFYWKSLNRQVCVLGDLQRVDALESDAYFASRPRGSQLAAWASDQSQPLADRDALVARLAAVAAKYEAGAVPRPPHWGGTRLMPRRFEFWQDGRDRMHDRLGYTLSEEEGTGGWVWTYLNP
ncbi:MAG: pyridoxamine 5'-phosphate oxidase [Pseudomonadota bacterium]